MLVACRSFLQRRWLPLPLGSSMQGFRSINMPQLPALLIKKNLLSLECGHNKKSCFKCACLASPCEFFAWVCEPMASPILFTFLCAGKGIRRRVCQAEDTRQSRAGSRAASGHRRGMAVGCCCYAALCQGPRHGRALHRALGQGLQGGAPRTFTSTFTSPAVH